jgi:hypothetical protein
MKAQRVRELQDLEEYQLEIRRDILNTKLTEAKPIIISIGVGAP